MKKLSLFLAIFLLILGTLQAQVEKTIYMSTEGSLSSLLTTNEQATITKLTVTGNIDARDFKTMRDNMPLLAILDLSGASIVAYTGTEGTYGTSSTVYLVNEIPIYAFYNSSISTGKPSLISVVLPVSTNSIGDYAFSGCIGLGSISISNAVTSIGGSTFSYCNSLTTITIPASVKTIGNSALRSCTKLTAINVESGNMNYSTLVGVLFDKTQTTLIQYPNGKIGSSYIIPSSVTSIGSNAFYSCSGLTSVTIPSSVKSIGTSAFASCSSLTSTTIPSSVTAIGSGAFQNCSSLTTITIPASVKTLDDGALAYCTKLTAINVESGNLNYSSSNGVLFNITQTTLIQYPNGKIGSSYIIPSSVTLIGSGVFASCKGLTSVTIPSSVTYIGDYAFYYCTGLTSIYMNNLPLAIKPATFSGVSTTNCTLNVPYSTKTLYAAANYWKSFTNIVEPSSGFSLDSYNVNMIGNTGSSTVGISANVKWTASSDQSWLTVSPASGSTNNTLTLTAQANQTSTARTAIVTVSASGLEWQTITVKQNEGPKTIAITAGGLSTALTSIELLTIKNLILTGSIDARDFKTMRDNMPVLASIDLSGVNIVAYTGTEGTYSTSSNVYPANEIPIYAFFNSSTQVGKSSLTSVVLPLSLSSIGSYAFRYCNGITSVNIPTSVIYVGNYAFSNCNGLTSVTIPSSVTSLGDNVFFSCGSLASINIPLSVTSIGSYAFENCSNLATITIPANVKTIGTRAFAYCTKLTAINVESSNLNYSSSDGVLFDKTQTTIIQYPKGKVGSSYSIPSTVATIGNYALYYCSGLTSVTIPSSVTTIGSYAFYYCTGLTSLNMNSKPMTISSSTFTGVNTSTCTLNVPYSTKVLYTAANYWKNFSSIVEPTTGFILDAYNKNMLSSAGSSTVGITANVAWNASSDQSWLTVSPSSGTGNNTFTLTVQANLTSTPRTAIVTVSASGLAWQTITVKQYEAPKALTVTAGGLSTALTSIELSTLKGIVLTGSIDARDFKTMRDRMPLLASIDLSGVNIVAYTGAEGTYSNSVVYPANEIPAYAFNNTTSGRISLVSLTLPLSINSIGNYAFYYCNGVTSISIPNSVTSIGNYAFQNCSSLTTITIPASVKTINNSALVSCTKLTAINVESGNLNFSSLDGVLFNNTQTTIIQYPIAKVGSIYSIPSTVTTIGASAFNNCFGLTSVTIPASATTIGSSAFYGCTSLTSLNIPSAVTSIGNSAFNNCIGLTSIYVNNKPLAISSIFSGVNTTTCVLNVPYNTKTLYAAADYWKNFTNIVEPTSGFVIDVNNLNLTANSESSTVGITANVAWSASSDQLWLTVTPNSGTGNGAFTINTQANPYEVSRAGTITVTATGLTPQMITVLQAGNTKSIIVTAGNLATILSANELTGITDLVIFGSIDARDFKTMRENMPVLAKVDLSNANIAAYTGIEGTYSTSSTEYPANEIPSSAFYNSTTGGKRSLTKVVVPLSTNSIGNNAFYYCSGLTNFIIPSSVTSIGSNGFRYCTALTSINIPYSVTTIGSYCFANCSALTSINIPSSVNMIGTGALYNCSKLTEITVESANLNYSSSNGVLFNKTQTTLIQYPNGKIENSYNVPTTVTTIGINAFYYCNGLTSVTMPSTVTSIENGAFYYCTGLTSFTIPSSVTSIGSSTFAYCTGLTSVFIPSSVTSIGNSAFYYCTGLTSIIMNSKPITISSSSFSGVNTTTCILNVPYSTRTLYVAANYWRNFSSIVEPTTGFILDAYNKNMLSSAGSSTVGITANVAWNASSDQSWLTVSKNSGTGNDTIPIIAQANLSELSRVGTVTFTATGATTQTITVFQAGVTKTMTVSAGSLATILSTTELSKLTDLAISGSIDARDFKTMRDNMPVLARVDLSNANIAAYTGTEGTYSTNSTIYAENEVPANAFYNSSIGVKMNLVNVDMPLSTKSIGSYAFTYCTGLTSVNIPTSVTAIGNSAFENCSSLTSVTIPSSVTTIGSYAFYYCTGLSSINVSATIPVDLSLIASVFTNVNKTSCTLYVPSGAKTAYQTAVQWKDFINIIEITTAIPCLSDKAGIRVYPNPVVDNLTIQGVDTNTKISIVDLSGRVMIEKQINSDNSVSLDALQRGQYILRLLNTKGAKNFKIVKQ